MEPTLALNDSRIYLDHAATTPMRPEAVAAVMEGMARWANPSSPHAEGRAARAALEDARKRIAKALDWPHHVILTSGASESAALALRGRPGIAVAAVEHDAVLRAAERPIMLDVNASGIVVNGEGAQTIALQSANSESGVLQDRPTGVWIVDCSQTAGKLPLPEADLIIVSAHKLGGPPGIGALLVRDLGLLDPTGGQERGYRGGTENLPGALGFAAALEAPRDWFPGMADLRAQLDEAILASGGEIVAQNSPRIPTIASYRMPGVSSAAQLIRLDMAGFAVSAGSACSSGSMRPSHVLAAMGYSAQAAAEVVRVSFGWTTTAEDVAKFAEAWTRIAQDIKRAA
ncbi:aminotransferase class V-fold PLP-dependent enzyme [Sphingomonas sp. H160509]|uniref:cysteine desulfurase family protein n=1 Tax=Sphingomonas sp. H160509 TaxID=2955313 RepID=UPI0021E9A4B4|nr:aminotransferase class V-fold PLP-dependent enzyme [Sphingomonas sp. H160509]MDD1452930.1 aminotransferase class V-fold PLP-dependent enzyme [Sphingomonas sp. H160509]